MHHITFLQDLAVVMCVAAFATILFRQFKQPVVLGYILAGVLIGPHTPPYSLIGEKHTVETLAELGVIFLMFALGLEFSFRKLQKVGATAVIAAALEILLMIFVGYELGRAFGWNQMDSIFLGAILSISSTTIIIKALEGLNLKNEGFASIIVGILIVEDILAIVMIALLSGFAATGQFNAPEIGMTILGLAAFLGTLLVLGLIIVPRLLNYVAKFKSDEMLLVTVIGLCFGVSLITVKLGYSVALGAFLIGAIIAESRHIFRIEGLMIPVRDMFSAVFFVSIGLLIDPMLIWKYKVPILVITAAVIIGKVITCSLGCLLAGNDTRTSLRVGMSLAQIGEFSFIIAALGLSLKVTSDFIYPIAVAVSALTTLSTPYLISMSDGLVANFNRLAPRPLLSALDTYTQWAAQLGKKNDGKMERKILTKLALQILLNLLIIAAVFIGAIFLRSHVLSWSAEFPGGLDEVKAALWLAAMLVSFPSLVAVWRKLEVIAMVISELAVHSQGRRKSSQGIQSVISGIITVIGTACLIIIMLFLSSALLPSLNLLVLALIIAVAAGFLFYRGAVKVYARAQSALHETFAEEADPAPVSHHHHHASPTQAAPEAPKLPSLLSQAQLVSVKVPTHSGAIGKMLIELQLRSKTGASVVGIDREGQSIINPSPSEELAAGDEVLLIGGTDQLAAARAMIDAPAAAV